MSKFIAIFQAEADSLGHIIVVDPQGPIAWDTTEHIQEGCEDLYLAGPGEHTDSLRDFKEAPAWVRNWNGPYTVRVEKMSDEDADAFLAVHGEVVPAVTAAMPNLVEMIPDTDGVFGRAFRHALESVTLAMAGEGISHHVISKVLTTVLDAYGNNADHAKGPEEIQDMLVVSTGHLPPEEREAIEDGRFEQPGGPMVSMSREYGWLIYVRKPDHDDEVEPFEKALNATSEGFRGVINRAIGLGLHWVMFDRDANPLDGIPTYDDLGNVETD